MKKILFIGLLFLGQAAPSQTRVHKDSFAINLLTTMNRVYTIIEQQKNPFPQLAAEISDISKGVPRYEARIQLPGSIQTFVTQSATNFEKKKTTWAWTAILKKQPRKTADTAAFRIMQSRVDTLIKAFAQRTKNGLGSRTFSNTHWDFGDEYLLQLHISFEMPLMLTKQEIKDSILAVYRPLLMSRNTVKDASTHFFGALELGGFSNDEKKAIILPLMKEVINLDFYTGYTFILNRPYYISVENYYTILTPGQQERVRATAKKELDDYYASFKKPENNPVVEQQKKIEEKKVPTDPCEKEIFYLKHKPGAYVQFNGKISLIQTYSCPDNTYTICYVNAGNKLVFEKNIPTTRLDAASSTNAAPFIICRNCSGKGSFWEYDWYATNSYSGHYARSNKQRQYPCGVCWGNGHLKVR